ncbi:hypothetical protein [Pseudomarimonas arenosa]|uniref:Uncharacterized protein n=1 Tax=Pseudomarimonas arenosa TaxID=2774145 RepID=A0AAW3ZGG7_9GAMM|nr:hypothetical protein [Pseudomarimonas arenosa]MBD8524117.1 hypothetical protein [Pseudomarimonas arenosa]
MARKKKGAGEIASKSAVALEAEIKAAFDTLRKEARRNKQRAEKSVDAGPGGARQVFENSDDEEAALARCETGIVFARVCANIEAAHAKASISKDEYAALRQQIQFYTEAPKAGAGAAEAGRAFIETSPLFHYDDKAKPYEVPASRGDADGRTICVDVPSFVPGPSVLRRQILVGLPLLTRLQKYTRGSFSTVLTVLADYGLSKLKAEGKCLSVTPHPQLLAVRPNRASAVPLKKVQPIEKALQDKGLPPLWLATGAEPGPFLLKDSEAKIAHLTSHGEQRRWRGQEGTSSQSLGRGAFLCGDYLRYQSAYKLDDKLVCDEGPLFHYSTRSKPADTDGMHLVFPTRQFEFESDEGEPEAGFKQPTLLAPQPIVKKIQINVPYGLWTSMQPVAQGGVSHVGLLALADWALDSLVKGAKQQRLVVTVSDQALPVPLVRRA